MLTIDDSAFPTPALQAVSELTLGDTFRVSGKYYLKSTSTSVLNLTDAIATTMIGTTMVEKVNSTLVVTPFTA